MAAWFFEIAEKKLKSWRWLVLNSKHDEIGVDDVVGCDMSRHERWQGYTIFWNTCTGMLLQTLSEICLEKMTIDTDNLLLFLTHACCPFAILSEFLRVLSKQNHYFLC